jgi:hypothetical protein
MTDTHNVGFASPSRRLRSPSYPNISLPEAISLAHKIVDVALSGPIEEDDLARRLGYEPNSSWLGLRLSALSKFGLLEIIPATSTRGRICELTALGDKLMRWNSGSDEHKVALRHAALRPPIYNDLWTRFGPEFPTNREMATYLVDERKFNPNVVNTLLSDFRATAECADLKSMPRPKPNISGETIEAFANMHIPGGDDTRTVPRGGGTPHGLSRAAAETLRLWQEPLPKTDQRTTGIPLADGETATITMPKKMSPQSWQMLIDTLELWKKQAGAAEPQ